MTASLSIKQQLFIHCEQYIHQKINNAKKAIEAAQQAANEETKSSAGDKYETGRAMMQLEKEKHATQLNEGLKLQKVLAQITPQSGHQVVGLGSLVITSQASYYIAISAGKVTLDTKTYFMISLASPIGQALQNHQVGDQVVFRGQKITIKNIL
ncbi:3-oxoacyl-ACP synthase [marine bacterium AO1-C]|nr:3-oxoacyl-ACP synthase [marine bacterium AO1-C]